MTEVESKYSPIRLLLAAATLCLAVMAQPAQAEQLITDMSAHKIAIRSNFTGTQILLFGAVETDNAKERALARDVIVVVSGPSNGITVRRKERLAGIWVNHDSVTFPKVPGFYAIASTRDLDVVADKSILEREQIGIENVNIGEPVARSINGTPEFLSPEERKTFVDALIRNKIRQNLFVNDPGGVVFLGQTLFRVTLDIPANVPPGLYSTTVFMLRDGEVVNVISSPLYIDKSGLERFIYRIAHSDPLLYGLITILGAALAGWLASAVLRER